MAQVLETILKLRRTDAYRSLFNPFMSSELIYFNSLNRPISNEGSVWSVCYYHCLREIFVLTANSVDPHHITKTYLYNFDPLKPHFYIVNLGFTGVYIIFLISAQK